MLIFKTGLTCSDWSSRVCNILAEKRCVQENKSKAIYSCYGYILVRLTHKIPRLLAHCKKKSISIKGSSSMSATSWLPMSRWTWMIQRETVNLSRIAFPYLNSPMGIGINNTHSRPSKVFPQPRPSAEYIGGPARGKKAPTSDLVTVSAAMADAAYWS